MKWRNNMNRRLLEIEKARERELINRYFFGVPALTKKKNGLFFLPLIMGPGFLICLIPTLRDSHPFLQNGHHLLFLIIGIGAIFGLAARGFLKRLSNCWKDVLSNFMKQKPEFPRCPFNIQKIYEKNHAWVIASYALALCFILFGAINIDYSSVVFTTSRSVKNSIIHLMEFIFFSFTWGIANLWMTLKIECIFSDID